MKELELQEYFFLYFCSPQDKMTTKLSSLCSFNLIVFNVLQYLL